MWLFSSRSEGNAPSSPWKKGRGLLRWDRWDRRFLLSRWDRRYRKPIYDIARRYEGRVGYHTADDIKALLEEQGIALEILLCWLYEYEIEPTEEEKRVLRELGEKFQLRDIVFWPEPPDDVSSQQ